MASKQGVYRVFYARNKKAKYRLTFRTTYGQSLSNGQLAYKYSKATSLSYKD